MDFLGIGSLEVLAILLVAFLVLGPARMAEMARSLGSFIRDVRRTTGEIPALLAMEEEADRRVDEDAPARRSQPQGAEPSERRRDVD